MPNYIYILFTIFILLSIGYVGLYIFAQKIHFFEQRLIAIFSSRTDTIAGLYEISKNGLGRHNEIFSQILSLRKQEFSLIGNTKSIEGFIELEQHIHHEINFIFQVCNKNQTLIKDKNFLYIRDVIINKSSAISKELKKYRKIIEIYNKAITYKNYSIIGLLLPFHKKTKI